MQGRFNLKMLLREMKDSYRIEFPEAGSNLDPEEVEPQAWEGCKYQSGLGSEKAKIAFSLSGALSNIPNILQKRGLFWRKLTWCYTGWCIRNNCSLTPLGLFLICVFC